MIDMNAPLDEIRKLPGEDRIRYWCSGRWISYDRAQTALGKLDELFSCPPKDRMPCLLIYGATGMGKTKIIRKFERDHAAVFDRATGMTSIPVVSFQMPPSPEESNFYDELLRALGGPVLMGRTITKTKDTCRSLLRMVGAQILMIDEIHNLLAGSARAQRIFLNTLRFLANDCRIPLVCVGTDEAQLALLGDGQLAERFSALKLPRWKNDDSFRRLLKSLTDIVPVRGDRELDTPARRKIILDRSDGVTTRIFGLIEAACKQVIGDGSESLTEAVLASNSLVLPLVSMGAKAGRRTVSA